jgi:hypothetical protein
VGPPNEALTQISLTGSVQCTAVMAVAPGSHVVLYTGCVCSQC